jgi:hypothetical protein
MHANASGQKRSPLIATEQEEGFVGVKPRGAATAGPEIRLPGPENSSLSTGGAPDAINVQAVFLKYAADRQGALS